ncbi:MAG: 3-hydroxyacyl-CoA dehydrogenase/enoyl-CoA hydratase family protein [Euryarchaeota archaeon]|jgi:enoyl-CoA hydratase / 3-hydroxyacyl-CoA dehydrogenase|nr:3-hydroxyacyl-CoA dehydrogenase/enoyl-CoA hydratase family protein [Euryarchaeota archaeon]MBT4802063.1 3-hydroxyacyl-CoA dehydrogenase/enoyl-CoA hydratase family protein [Euryarchaeota archaeon]MBT6684319.1 3-hydroxyacyl-CoA dehydrogenase/enoyl-CoA hydratase family protein [Euryarchaeota archaeon]MBT6873644.1 3-hydroxyacyl-CoA dehydrogenase/enoyl-CoA hydratase family protein [Euryarchaeota archaeon]MBT7413677.1 3-hydroxyacyl-CoA dehydrogenase/enoyl-CoA hydratase family protein [Euryarchaeot
MSSIKTVAIIGSGNMGSGIAQKSAQENFEIQMVDREEKWVNHGQEIISNLLEQALERRIFNIEQVNSIKEKISGVVGTNNVDPKTDLVIEAVFEDFNVKKDVFTILDQVCNEHTILASNTSSLSVNDLAKASGRPDRFIGLHFFYHPAKNRLVEIIPAESTTKNTLKAVETYCKTMGKVVIICKDRPGFVVNRFFVPWLNEACILLQEGVATAAQIDSIAREAFNIGMGPFALMNLTGPTIALHATDYLAEQLDTPRYTGAKNLREIVDKGELWKIGDEEHYDENLSITVKERLLGQVFAVAGQIVDEEICSKEDVDRGAKVGLRWDEGPFEIANKIGIKEAYRMAEKYCKLVNFKIPITLENQFNISEDFIFSYIDVEINDSVAIVRLNRPEAMNALNVKLVTELGDVIEGLNQNSSVNTIVLEGAGKAFVAGADVKFFVDKINEDSFQEIYDFTAHGHEVLNKIENSSKVTIALTTGLALGGGLELALSCDYRIGTNRTQFRFPETNIGIYPGLGGTQRTTRICGLEIARYAVLAGNFLNSETAKAFGLLTHLVDVNDIDKTIYEIINLGKNNDKYLKNSIDEDHSIVKFARRFYTDENLYSILNGSDLEDLDMSDNQVSRQIKSLSRTAPIALSTASKLLDIANNKDTEFNQGLKQELDNLEYIFSTSDSLEGLSALIEGRRAKYKNS